MKNRTAALALAALLTVACWLGLYACPAEPGLTGLDTGIDPTPCELVDAGAYGDDLAHDLDLQRFLAVNCG